jgi:hypothetical protein
MSAPFGDPDGSGGDLIRLFLEARISGLDAEFILRPSEKGVARWLGRTEIFNRARAVSEDVEDYLLRHTRLTQRDVVVLGNALCQHVADVRAEGGEELSDDVLRRVVGQVSRGFAGEQIRVCADRIGATAEALTARLEEVGKDRIDHAAAMALDGDEHLLDALWQHGLLGYDAPAYAHFYDAGELHLPLDKSSYVFHPCLPHLVRMQHTGPVPVRPYRR